MIEQHHWLPEQIDRISIPRRLAIWGKHSSGRLPRHVVEALNKVRREKGLPLVE